MKSRDPTLRYTQWGGVSNIVCGALVAAAYISHPHLVTPEVIAGQYWFWTHILFVFFLVFGVLGLLALMGHTIRNVTLSGFIGYITAICSLILIFGLNYYETFINPIVAKEASPFVEKSGAGLTIGPVAGLFPASAGLFVLGYILFSIDLGRSNQLGRGAPGLMIVSVMIFGAGLSGLFPTRIVQIGSALFGTATIWLGYRLFKAASDRRRLPEDEEDYHISTLIDG